MARVNQNQNFDVPTDYCGQGVNIKSHVEISESKKAKVKGVIKDGNGEEIGTVVLNDDRDKFYVDINGVTKMKRGTLLELSRKVTEHIHEALRDLIADEAENAPGNDAPTEG